MKHILFILLSFSIGCSSLGTKPTCSKSLKMNYNFLENTATNNCKKELQLCQMEAYKKQVDLDKCNNDHKWIADAIVNVGLAALGVLTGYLYASNKDDSNAKN